ncbi:hypothetical protein MMC25_001635 [Agyrium rufum]|nr:hypothetical protein [Agyrium rufum]
MSIDLLEIGVRWARCVGGLYVLLVLFNHGASATPTNTTSDPSAGDPQNPNLTGWQNSPSGRGTVDIVWSCTVTLFLSNWSSLCLNIPSPRDKYFSRFKTRFLLTGLSILVPEIVLAGAVGQWRSARFSVAEFHASGYPSWTITHAFFADMGGFTLETLDFPPFPLNAKQVHYLLSKGYLDHKSIVIDKHIIDDKNKQETFVRLLTCAQIVWFTINAIARVAQGLLLTTFELTTLGFIICAIPTYLCWIKKPDGVERSISVQASCSMAEIVLGAGASEGDPYATYSSTPLDFVSRAESIWSGALYWHWWGAIAHRLGMYATAPKRPIQRIPNDNFPPVTANWMIVFFLCSTAYSAVVVAGWNFWFPSSEERFLWKLSSVSVLAIAFAFFVVDGYAFYVHDSLKKWLMSIIPGLKDDTRARRWYGQFKAWGEPIRNVRPEKDRYLSVPVKAIVPITFMGSVYIVARCFIFLEDVIGLRRLPPEAFETVSWSEYIPHIT